MTQFPKFRFIKRDVGSIEFHSDAGCKSFTSTFVSFFFLFLCLFALCCLRLLSDVSLACLSLPLYRHRTVMTGDIITPPDSFADGSPSAR